MKMKLCKFCKVEHPLTSEFWYKQSVCKADKLAKNKAWSLANREKHTALKAACTERNKDQYKKTASTYYQNNKEAIHARRAERIKHHLPSKLADNLRSRLKQALRVWRKEKRGSVVQDLGCTIPELIVHLESKFTPGMSWETYGLKGWHIDHVRPLATFNLEDTEEFKQAMHYTNLQPLWARDNLTKGIKELWPSVISQT